jgi:transcriptional regulator with XRE-family HTH domain
MKKAFTEIVKDYISKHGITKTHLATLLGESPQNLTKKLSKNSIDAEYLFRISEVLGYDFFGAISRQHPHLSTKAFEAELTLPTQQAKEPIPEELVFESTVGYDSNPQSQRAIDFFYFENRELMKKNSDLLQQLVIVQAENMRLKDELLKITNK